MMGEKVPYSQDRRADFEFARLIPGDLIKIHAGNGVIYEKTIADEIGCQFSLPVPAAEQFYYATVDRKAKPFEPPSLWLISNPLYF
jgi:hypothetical protein